MPRPKRTRAVVEATLAKKSSAGGLNLEWPQKARAHDGNHQIDDMELLAVVCGYFCDGRTACEIKNLLKEEYSIEVTREVPYQLFSYAASRGWMEFTPPQEYTLRERIKKAYPWLHDVQVVRTAAADDVARGGAAMLLELLRRHFPAKEVHVGFSGGRAMRQVACHFSALLRGLLEDLPQRIVFHALVAGFDIYDPTTDANAFFTYFVKDSAMQVETSFVGLHTPPVIPPEQLNTLRALGGIKDSYRHVEELNVVVTSARDWSDEHSALKRYMKGSGQSLEAFEKAGAVGDLLWRPIGPDGPVEVAGQIRAMTVMELDDVADFVEEGKRVLLVAGPCAVCHRTKTRIVKTVLEQDRHFITHLVIDSRCGRELLQSN